MSTAPSEVLMPAEKSKKKVKKPAKAAQMPSLDELGVMVHEIENMSREQAFAAVHPLMETVDQNYVRLGGVLAVIRDNGWWEGHETFRDFLDKTFGLIRYRKSMYLIQIYEDLVKSAVKWKDVRSIGWCKLKEISPVLTEENCAEWVAKAEQLTVIQLREVVKATQAAAESGKTEVEDVVPTTTTMTFKVHVDQKQTIKQALERARKETGTEYDAVALEGICINYLAGGKVTKKVKGAQASLKDVLETAGWETVLDAFGELWPEIEVEVRV